jgi:hypothetical protein
LRPSAINLLLYLHHAKLLSVLVGDNRVMNDVWMVAFVENKGLVRVGPQRSDADDHSSLRFRVRFSYKNPQMRNGGVTQSHLDGVAGLEQGELCEKYLCASDAFNLFLDCCGFVGAFAACHDDVPIRDRDHAPARVAPFGKKVRFVANLPAVLTAMLRIDLTDQLLFRYR